MHPAIIAGRLSIKEKSNLAIYSEFLAVKKLLHHPPF